MGRFTTFLQSKNPKLITSGANQTIGKRFSSLSRDVIGTYDKALYAQVMGVQPKPTPVQPTRAEKLTGFNTGQSWRADNAKKVVSSVSLTPPKPTMAAVRAADLAKPKPVVTQHLKAYTPPAPAPAEKLTGTDTGQSYRRNPQEVKPGEVRTLKDVGKAAKDAFDLWNAQGTKGVNGIMYWLNDLLAKAHPNDPGRTAENKQYAALQMDLASDKERAIMEKAKGEGTWYETVVTAVNGGLSLLQSLAMGTAIHGGQVAGSLLANTTVKEAGKIAAAQLAKQVGYKAAMTGLKQALDKAVIDVGMPTAASWFPAWISSGIEGGAIYRELTDQGKSPVRASAAALVSIAGTALSESIELDGMYQTWSRNVGSELGVRFVNALGQATAETVQELGQNLWQNGVRMAIGQDDEQKLATWAETIDTIIGIFPSSFVFGAGTFNAAAFRQQYKAETSAITSAIKEHFGVDDATADAMLDEAVTKFTPAIRDTFLNPLANKGKLSDVLTFERSTDPYVQFLVKEFTKPIAETKQTAAARPHFAITSPSSQGLRTYTALLNAPSREQQATGRHKWQRLYEQQQATTRVPLTPEVGVRPEFQKPGVNLTPPVQRPNGPITEAAAPARAPLAKSGGPAAISANQPSVSTSPAATAPQNAQETPIVTDAIRNNRLSALIDYVPTSFVAQASDTQTNLAEDVSPEAMAKLTEDIRKNGVQSPLILEYNPETGFIKIVEGIHRLRAAQELGLKFLPVTMVRAESPVTDTNLNIGKYTGEEYLDRQFAPSFLKEIPTVRAETIAAPVASPAAVTPQESNLFTAPVEPTQEERLIEQAKKQPEVQKSEAELAIEQAGAEAEAQQQAAEDLDLWKQTPDDLNNLETIRKMQALFDTSAEGRKAATLRSEIARIQQGTFTDEAKADLVAKKAQLRALQNTWDDAHGWLAQVNRAMDLGLYEEAVASGDMSQEQVNAIMVLRQQLQADKDQQDTADAQLEETRRLRLALEQQRESTRPTLELTAEEEGKGSEVWVGKRNPTKRELLLYVIKHHPMEKTAFDPYYGKITNEEKRNRAEGAQAKAQVVKGRPLLGQLMPDTLASGVKRVGMDELASILESEVGLEFPASMPGEKNDDRLAAILYEAAGPGQKNATVDYLDQPLNTPAARAARQRQQEPPETNPEDFANVVNEQMPEYTPEEQAIANRTGRQVGAVGTGETVVSRYVRTVADKGDRILDFGAGAKAVQAQLLSQEGYNVTAYDFGENVGPLHNPNALDEQYPVVYAGNVLNVQSSQDMLSRTLDQIAAAVEPNGTFVGNLPLEPRKFNGLTADLVEQELGKRFENVERKGPTNAPVFVASNPLEAKVREDNLFTGPTDKWEWGAEPAAAIPGEPMSFYGAKNGDFDTAKAVIIYDEDTKTGAPLGYKVQLADGQTLANPNAKEIGGSPYFDSYDEAQAYADQRLSSSAQKSAFSKQAMQQAEAAQKGLKKAVEGTQELTTRQETQRKEELDPDSLFGGTTQSSTEDLFAKKIEEPNPERGRPLIPDEDLFAAAEEQAKERTKQIIPAAKEAVQTAADSAVSLGFPNGGRITAVGISKQFLYQGSLKLDGQTIRSARDLAVIGQIFRNPLFETARYIWCKDGVVLYNEGRTSRMISTSELFLKDEQADIKDMLDRAKKAGANQLWVLHNHPNGWAMPSKADYSATHHIADAFCDGTGITMMGHVIVDTNQYGLIHTEAGSTGRFNDDPIVQLNRYKTAAGMPVSSSAPYTADVYSMTTDNRYLQPYLDNPLIGQWLRNADNLADFGKAIKANDAFVTLVYTDGASRTRLVTEVPFTWFVGGDQVLTGQALLDSLDTIEKFVQSQGIEYGASRCFALYSSADIHATQYQLFTSRVVALMAEDVLTDGVTYDSGIKLAETVSTSQKVSAPQQKKLGITAGAIFAVQEDTPTGYTFDDPKAATSPQNLRFVDALFTDFDEIVRSFNGLAAGEYQKAVEGWWQHQVWEQLKAAKIPADVFKPGEVVNKYRMSKGPKSTYNNLEWIKNKLEAWVRDQATTELENAKTKKLEPHAALNIEQAARAAGVVQKPSTMLAPQPSKKTAQFMDPFWKAIEDRGGHVQHPETAGTDASTKDLLNIVSTYEGAARQTAAYRKMTRGDLVESVANISHVLAEQLGGGEALAKPFELPVITSKTGKLTMTGSDQSKVRNAIQGMEALEYVFRRLDKGEYHGRFWRTFYEPINNAKDYELRMEDRIQAALNAKIAELGLDVKKLLSETRHVESDVRPGGVQTTHGTGDELYDLTVDDLMAVYLHSKNMDNLRHLLSPTGNRFTKQEVLNVIDALTPQEIELADWMQATRQLDGILAAQVTWDTKMKNMLLEQNYWAIERETRDVAVQNVDDELMEKIEAGKGLTPTQVEAGFTKERTHAAGNPIKLQALESFISGESRVQHYIATMPVIDYLTRVVGNSEFAMAYINKEGKSGWLMLHKWLQDVANPDLGTGARNQYERFMRWMRGNAASALLGFRTAQFFKAGLSWWVGAAEEGDMNAVRGLLSFIGNREATYELVRKYAPQVYHRSMEREIAEAKITQSLDARLAAKKTLREWSMIFTVMGDRLSVMGLWKGQFDAYLRAHPDADLQEAADRASEVVRLTQAAWDVKDQPEIQRSGEAMKLLTMFTNEVTRHYSYLRDSMMQYHERKLPFGQLIRRLIEVLIVQGLIMGSINRKAPPKDAGEAMTDVVQQTLEVTLPVLGRYLTNGMEGFVDSSPAGVKLLQELARGASNIVKIPDKGIGPTVGSIATIMGYFWGLPVEGAKDIYKFLTPDQVKAQGNLPEGY